MIEHRVHTRADAADLLMALEAWDLDGTYVGGLHVGDVAWSLRGPDAQVEGRVHGWWRDGHLVAAALVEDAVARPRISPGLLRDEETTAHVADFLEALPGEQLWSDADHGSRLRQVLAVRGWDLDPDPWVSLYADASPAEATGRVEPAHTDPGARVAVQRSGFERSTFDRASWDRMAALPAYDAELDLVLRDDDGVAVAVGTAWLAGRGTAIVEPLAVHADHRRRGHGATLSRALLARCLDRGASGVSVATPAANTGAVATYRAAGFHPVETLQPMVRPRR